MTAKEYLEQIKYIDTQIHFLEREIKRWKEMSVRVSGSNFEPHYNPNHVTEATFIKCFDKIEELEKKLQEKVEELVVLKAEILNNLYTACTVEQRTVLMLRFIDSYSTADIVKEMYRSQSWVYQVQHDGLEALDTHLKKSL